MTVDPDIDGRREATRLMRRTRALAPLAVVILTVGAFALISLVARRADTARRDQLRAASVTLALDNLQSAPFKADPAAGGSPLRIRRVISHDETTIARGLTPADPDVPTAVVHAARQRLAEIIPVVTTIYDAATGKGGLAARAATTPIAQEQLTTRSAALSHELAIITRDDARTARRARRDTDLGTAAALALLLTVFLVFYVRSVRARRQVGRLAGENERLLQASRREAITDALTGLENRRALESDLAAGCAEPVAPGNPELLMAIFDLDGFKQYNDTYGHEAGDVLLRRLGGHLAAVARPQASAYRMGGDEFCLLVRCGPSAAEAILSRAAEALSDSGDEWHIGCSYGAAWVPSEAANPSDALRLADQRMYADKRSRASASRQLTDVLLAVISEQDAHDDRRITEVSRLATRVARELGQPEPETERIRVAATLHDIGNAAIPRTILDKPGPLTRAEWAFVRCHTAIGERFLLAAPALAATAPLVRSSHERVDGAGYPDGLCADAIPLGARIIAVCDAYAAMTSDRPHRTAETAAYALQELQRCRGSQFDAAVVDAFCRVVDGDEPAVPRQPLGSRRRNRG